MKNRAAALSAVMCLCASLWAQNGNPECSDIPPKPIAERGDNAIFDPNGDRCGPAIPPRQSSFATISARALAHRPSKAARQEFDRGMHAWRKSRFDQALQHMTEAVRLDSGFAEAQIELGAFNAQLGQVDVGLEHIDRALVLEPNSPLAHSAKASALVIVNRYEEAEKEARLALQFDPGSVESHYMLGVSLVKQGHITEEAALHLEIAADKYPNARALLAQVEAELADRQSH